MDGTAASKALSQEIGLITTSQVSARSVLQRLEQHELFARGPFPRPPRGRGSLVVKEQARQRANNELLIRKFKENSTINEEVENRLRRASKSLKTSLIATHGRKCLRSALDSVVHKSSKGNRLALPRSFELSSFTEELERFSNIELADMHPVPVYPLAIWEGHPEES
ncbi:hypothetical protein TNCV_3554251 [Trichonephila clavipes]|nr:hypothetical protein TNCV_3554251 [Trichonephila clavipes]